MSELTFFHPKLNNKKQFLEGKSKLKNIIEMTPIVQG